MTYAVAQKRQSLNETVELVLDVHTIGNTEQYFTSSMECKSSKGEGKNRPIPQLRFPSE